MANRKELALIETVFAAPPSSRSFARPDSVRSQISRFAVKLQGIAGAIGAKHPQSAQALPPTTMSSAP